ncbi:hypothetical protein SAMN00777080_0500 [Aquiflexum balticum DSM 16537]|uniref:Glycosyltransferase RgtA/B/C/D-like domain-containing protein n=1 Tax=Aquiflexum balticum DSM 16537 TaxID=758820 RepID=A0A1W2GZK4_9BACT|nr:hypothetical protein SAMN00777080_0500 [Aquiflexum balticum DSM 16537]
MGPVCNTFRINPNLLSFFRINDPSRLLVIIALLLLLSSVYIWVLDIPLLQPEMIWLLLGERMADGKHMYIDIIDDTGPLSSGIYWVCYLIFGKSVMSYKLLSLLVIIFQIVYINNLYIRYKSFEENTYIPALVMVILFHLSFDMITLSPALMGSTFIVLAFGQLFSQTVLQKEGSDSILLVGIFGGIAACFHFPLITFLPFLLVAGIVVSGFSFRQLILAIVSYALPLTFCALYYFWIDGLPAFLNQFIISPRLIESYAHVTYRDLAILFSLPLFFTTLGFFVGLIVKSQTVNQQKQLQLTLIFLIFAVGSLLLTNRRTPYQFIVIIPGLAYFITFLFVAFKKGVPIKVLSLLFVFGIPMMGYSWIFLQTNSGNISTYAVSVTEEHTVSEGKKILVLGEDLGYYQKASLATPYLHYRLSKIHLEKNYGLEKTAEIFQNFQKEKPDLIVDEEEIFRGILEKMPLLKDQFILDRSNVYRRKK